MDETFSKTSWYTIFIMAVTSWGGMLYGYDLGIIASAMAFMRRDIAMTLGQLHIMPGLILFGGAIATLVTGPLCDILGRRKVIIIGSIIFIAGVSIFASAHYFISLLAGRLIQGLATGMISIAIPLYIAETVPAKIRGKAIAAFQLLLTAGILFSSLIGLYFTPSGNWRGMFWFSLFPGAILLIGSCVIPESPRWLSLKERWDKTLFVLRKTRDAASAKQEFTQLQTAIAEIHQAQKSQRFVWEKRYTRPVLVVFAIAVLCQLTAINSFLQLAPTILKSAGLGSNVTAMLGHTAITGLNFLVTIISLFLIDRVGGKFLLCLGTAGIVLTLTYCGWIYYGLPYGHLKGILLLAGILAYIFSFAIGPGVVIWMVLSELLPLRIRSSGMAIAFFIKSMTSAVLVTIFLGLAEKIGFYGVFWLCGFFTLLYFLTVYFGVPETKNKTLEEIEKSFNHDK